MNKSKVSYQTEIVDTNKIVESLGSTSMSFELLGDIPAFIKGDIPLTADKIREFNNYPGQCIDDNFSIKFDSTSTGTIKQVLVVRTYHKEVK